MPDIFLSYSREDQATARLFAETLGHAGFEVWWDATLRSGEAYDEVTEKALRDAKAVVVLWSRKSVVSRWVRAEATLADRCKTLLPVMIEACERPIMFELTQTAELSHWQGNAADKAWVAFLGDVRRFLEAKGLPAERAHVPAPETTRVRTPAASAQVSIVVLPFANMSGDPEQEYFSDGISEDIITDLSKVSALSVISRNSAFSFKGKHVDLPQVARQLQVTHVLEGSVRRSGNRVRITAQLIDGAANNHIWAERYDRDLSDIFTLQDEISQAIVAALKVKLFPEEKKAITEHGTTNLAAYDKFLRARALIHRIAFTDEAIKLIRDAIALDPAFIEARAALIQAYLIRMTFAPDEFEEIARELAVQAREALSTAPGHWATYLAQGYVLRIQGDPRGSAAAIAKMRALMPPSDAGALYAYAVMITARGCMTEGIQVLETARKVDPLSLAVAMQMTTALYSSGRAVEAEAEYQRALPLEGNREPIEHYALLWTWQAGDVERTKLQAHRLLHYQHRPTPVLEEILRVIDKPAECLALVRGAFEDADYQDSTRMMFLSWYAVILGDVDLAMAALRRCYVEMHGIYRSPIWLPIFGPLRRTAAFKQLVRDMGIYETWRATGSWGDFARPVGDDDFECW